MRVNLKFCLVLLLGLALTGCTTFWASHNFQVGKRQYTDRQYILAARTLTKAAMAGNTDAQYALGYLYFYGQGVPQSYTLAKYWMQMSAQQGNARAMQALSLFQNLIITDEEVSAILQDNSINSKEIPHQHQQQTRTRVYPITSTKVYHDRPPAIYEGVKAKQASNSAKIVKAQTNPSGCVALISDGSYRIQLMGLSRPEPIKAFIAKHNLAQKAQCYHTSYRGDDWYILSYGRYTSYGAAHSAFTNLPANLKALKPWIRPF